MSIHRGKNMGKCILAMVAAFAAATLADAAPMKVCVIQPISAATGLK